jgi:TPR repeat protein
MRIQRLVSDSVLLVALACGAVGEAWAQDTDFGTSAASMPDPSAAKIALQVTADGDYTWKIGSEQGQITAAMGMKQVMIAPGRYDMTAKGSDGKWFEQLVMVARGKQNSVRITGKLRPIPGKIQAGPPSAPSPVPAPPTENKSPTPASPAPPLARGTYTNPYAGNPDMFVRVTPQASQRGAARSRIAQPRQTVASGWQVTVMAFPLMGTYYDIKVQVIMKGVGSAGSIVELPDMQPGPIPSTFTAVTNELGKEAVVCYTARAASQTAQRWTGTFTIQNGAVPGMASFVAAHEPTLEKASDAPCGGLNATKESATPATETGAVTETRDSAVDSREANLALARGSQLYNARRYAEARPLLIKACEVGGSADACNSVGFMYQNNMGVAKDYTKAREYYSKACNDDSSFSCNNLGTLYQDGLGVPRDYAQALKLFEKSCDVGVPEGCDAAGKMYVDHIGVAQDNAQALELFKKACDNELAAGCGDEGTIYARGLGVPKDLRFAASLFTRACGMGSRNSCFNIGMMYRIGDGVTRDPVKANEYLTKACNMGDQQSCGLAR